MAEYRIVVARSAERDLGRLPHQVKDRILAALVRLTRDPRARGIRKLRGANDLWRLRIGDYRVIFKIDDAEHLVDISHIRHRREAYE